MLLMHAQTPEQLRDRTEQGQQRALCFLEDALVHPQIGLKALGRIPGFSRLRSSCDGAESWLTPDRYIVDPMLEESC